MMGRRNRRRTDKKGSMTPTTSLRRRRKGPTLYSLCGGSSKPFGITVLIAAFLSFLICVAMVSQFILMSHQDRARYGGEAVEERRHVARVPVVDRIRQTQGVEVGGLSNQVRGGNAPPRATILEETGNEGTNDENLPRPPHLHPPLPPLPPFAPLPDADRLASDVLEGRPTVAGIAAVLGKFLLALHSVQADLASRRAERDEVLRGYFDLASEHLLPLEARYRGRPVFPVREDGSVYVSLASFREHLLADTLRGAFGNAARPDAIFVGAFVQNCFGLGGGPKPCKTGAQVIGKNAQGRDMTRVSDAPPDVNGVEEFCGDATYKKFCDSGQVRVLYVNETESLGPAVARYYASKLWGGETYFVQVDSHLQFARHWDEKYIHELKAAKSYPKAVLSAYPPGFVNFGEGGTPGARLCHCEFSTSDVENQIIRINTGSQYRGGEDRPTQIPFIAAGFFFARAEFLVDVPFDPLLPWCFMGEEIALSMRAWTSGWDIYAPRVNLIAHQYRPGRMGLPKFWGSVGRLYGRPQMNTKLQRRVIQRVKHLVGYPEATREAVVESDGDDLVLRNLLGMYGLGTARSQDAYMKLTGIDVHAKGCQRMDWCNNGELE